MAPAGSDSTVKLASDVERYELLVAAEGKWQKVPLAAEGELVLGRSEDADVRVDSISVSRRHALVRVRSGQFTVEDLGSSNGTIVRGKPVAPGAAERIAPGESFLVGEYVVLVRPVHSRATVRHIWRQESFEARVAEQCERSRESGNQRFFVVRVHLSAKPRGEPSQLLAAELRGSDVLGQLDTNDWAVLLVDESETTAEETAARIEETLTGAGADADVTVLAYPRDGSSASALLSFFENAPVSEVPIPDVVVRSPVMVELYRQIEPVARAQINVLILGETGVGKDVLAQSIHERSSRRGKPFLRLNCAAIAESLLESELFGHEKGAFTGAVQRKPGLLEAAEGGTVFLDEIGELPQALQSKLLQVIENREILSVGSVKPRTIDVRFLAATNRDLEADALSRRFRSDLYYRLAGFTAVIPPLRERREDILPLAQGFVRRVGASLGRSNPTRIREDAAVHLLDYPWPGNVRELRNVIERALVLSEGRSIGSEHLPLEKMRSTVLVAGRRTPPVPEDPTAHAALFELTPEEQADRQRILDALNQCAGNQSLAAERLGISRSTLLNRITRYRIRRPRKREAP